MLSYASIFSGIPNRGRNEEINFGGIYLGQTVRLLDGDFNFTGVWDRNEGKNGQLGVYAGYGRNFPQLAYNLSMVLHDKDVLSGINKQFLLQRGTLEQAISARPVDISYVFNSIQEQVNAKPSLAKAYNSGRKIMELLYP